jgi:hypothetical protein
MLLTRIVQITFTFGFIALMVYGAIAIKREGFIREDTNEMEK